MMKPFSAGLVFGAVAALTYGMNPLFALTLYRNGFAPDGVLLTRYLPAVAVLGSWMLLRRESFRVSLKELVFLISGGVIFGLSSLFLFLSYREMDAGVASTLLFVYPGITALMMWGLFHEKLTPAILVALGLMFSGIFLLCRKADGSMLSAHGVLFVMLSALTYAVYLVGVNRSVLKDMSSVKLTFYVLLSGSALYLIRLRGGMDLTGSMNWEVAWNIAGIVLLPTVLSLVCTALALQKAGATVTAILGALEPLTAVFFGVVVFHEAFTVRIACGILLILGAVILTALSRGRPTAAIRH